MQFLGNDFNKETQDAIYFYTPVYHALDNFSSHTVEIWGRTFQTGEHAYQWKKFESVNPLVADRIIKAASPDEVKTISNAHKSEVSVEFSEHKVRIMEEILLAKTKQHEKVRKILKESGTKTIIENSPVDGFWGIRADGKGENTLGKLWMKIRDSYDFENSSHTSL